MSCPRCRVGTPSFFHYSMQCSLPALVFPPPLSKPPFSLALTHPAFHQASCCSLPAVQIATLTSHPGEATSGNRNREETQAGAGGAPCGLTSLLEPTVSHKTCSHVYKERMTSCRARETVKPTPRGWRKEIVLNLHGNYQQTCANDIWISK